MRRTLVCLALAARAASADDWKITVEGGGEADTNVQHLETGPGIMDRPIAAGVVRLGGRIEHKGKLAGGTYGFAAGALAREVLDGSLDVEDVVLLTGNLRWLHPVGERPIAVGFALTAADDIPTADEYGARTFRNLGGDGLLVLRHTDTTLTLAAGGRQFIYKPPLPGTDAEAHALDWVGPTASARLDLVLWQSADGTRSFDLTALVGFEARAYAGHANANACAPGQKPDESCVAGTDILRRDRAQRAALELTWIGGQVFGLGYEVDVIDSNSFGQSLVRHKATASVTTSLPWRLYGTALATLELDQYLDGVLTFVGMTHHDYSNLDDENYSSLQFRLARAITERWSIEGRAAAWRDLGNGLDTSYKRSLVYLGAIYSN
jgi:hypothetical protein